MENLMKFTICGAIFGLLFVLCGLFTLKKISDFPTIWKTLPRERTVGTIIGCFALAWSVWLAIPLFEGGLQSLSTYLPFVAIAVAVTSYMFLEYLFTRALGGFLILTVIFLMHEAFAASVPARWVVSALCYLIVLCGMFMIGSPWRFRDGLRKLVENAEFRKKVGIAMLVYGLVFLGLAGGSRL